MFSHFAHIQCFLHSLFSAGLGSVGRSCVILWMAGPRRLQRCGSELSRCFNSQALLGWGCCSNTKWPFFLFSPGVPASVFKILLLLVPSTTFTCAGLQLPERPSMGLLSPPPTCTSRAEAMFWFIKSEILWSSQDTKCAQTCNLGHWRWTVQSAKV